MATRIEATLPCVSLLLLSVCVLDNARCAEPKPDDVPIKYRRSAEIERFADFALRNREYALPAHCTRIEERWNEASYQIVERPVLDSAGRLVRGAWVEKLPVTACGERRVYQIRVAVENRKCAIALVAPTVQSDPGDAATTLSAAKRVSVRVAPRPSGL